MDKDDFKQWKEDPVTIYFLKYLKDLAKYESTFIAESIASGEVIPVEDQYRISTSCMTLNQISDLDQELIENFYES